MHPCPLATGFVNSLSSVWHGEPSWHWRAFLWQVYDELSWSGRGEKELSTIIGKRVCMGWLVGDIVFFNLPFDDSTHNDISLALHQCALVSVLQGTLWGLMIRFSLLWGCLLPRFSCFFCVLFFFLANLTFLPAKTQGAWLLTPFASFMRSHLSACHSGGSTEQKPQPVCGRARECPCVDLWKSILICGRGDCSVVLESCRNAGGSTWVMMKCKTKPKVFSSKW